MTITHVIKRLIKHPLIRGGAVLVLGSLFANFFNFLFNLFMSRNLSVEDYGTLASVMSLIGFPALLAGAISPLIVQFAGNYFAVGKLDMIRGLYNKITKLFFIIGLIIIIFFLVFLPQVSGFFHIADRLLLVVSGVIMVFTLIGVINTAFLQAKLAFGFQVLLNVIATITKLLVGVTLVFFNLKVMGAVLALLASTLTSYILSFLPIKFVFNRNIISPKIKSKELFTYGLPSALTFVGLTSFISTDMILVKHFFSPTDAGLYAGLSLVARVVFYVSGPIGTVMFPIIVQKYSKNEKFTNTFKLSLFIVLVPSFLLTILYFIFPNEIILFFLKKKEYLSVAPLLGYFSLFITFYALLSILANFYLSIKKTNVYIPILGGAILQIVFINFLHQSFMQIILSSSAITFLLVTGLLLYYPYATRK